MWLEILWHSRAQLREKHIDHRHWQAIYGDNTVAGVTVMLLNEDLHYTKSRTLPP
jgi:hypothetical protein